MTGSGVRVPLAAPASHCPGWTRDGCGGPAYCSVASSSPCGKADVTFFRLIGRVRERARKLIQSNFEHGVIIKSRMRLLPMYFAVTDFVSPKFRRRLTHGKPRVAVFPNKLQEFLDVCSALRLQLKREIGIAPIEIGVSNSLLPRPGSTCRDAATLR
jgi:hypothetical protein